MAQPRTLVTLAISLLALSAASAQPQVVCSGEAAGGYAAFPDVCRLKSGELYCVFYSGYGHVSVPNDRWPKGGRIMAVRSSDDGKTWGKPVVAVDTDLDDRDPSVACLRDGTLLLNWFTLHKNQAAVLLARSIDSGKSWSEPVQLQLDSPYSFACSSPVRQLADGSLIPGLYCEDEKAKKTFGATVRSGDGGKTWKDLAYIGEKADIYLDAETDVVPLKDGKLLAALRSSKVEMHYAVSEDSGKTWEAVKSFGFTGHCPYFLRHSSGSSSWAIGCRRRRSTGPPTRVRRGTARSKSTPCAVPIRAWWSCRTAWCTASTTRKAKGRAFEVSGCGWARRVWELWTRRTERGAAMGPKKVSRNDPCPCGSGKKYKHCCYGKGIEDDLGLGSGRKPPHYPVGTVAMDGPDDKITTKIAAAVILLDGAEPIMKRWVATDVTTNPKVQQEMKEFFLQHGVKSVAMSQGNMGCPHEEGEDFPEGEDCPFCPFWRGKQGSNRME